jgi:hypothetical protein
MAHKTVRRTGAFKKGADPRRGHGKKGRSGRPPEHFRQLARTLLERHKILEMVAKIAQGTLTYDVEVYDVKGNHVGTEKKPPTMHERLAAARDLANWGSLGIAAEPREPPEADNTPRVYLESLATYEVKKR